MSATTDTAGLESVLTFDGQSSYIDIPTSSVLALNYSFTIEAWIKPDVLGKRIADKNFGGRNEGFTFDTYPQNLRFINKGVYLTSRNPLQIGVWQHVAITFKHDTNGAKLYIDGEADNVATPTQVGTVTQLPLRLGSQADKTWEPIQGTNGRSANLEPRTPPRTRLNN